MSGPVPLFPLPNVVLFPHMLLPLHIFEPRYRDMTRDAIQGEGRIAMGLLKPGWEENYYGSPPVFDVVGLGRILQHSKLEDGRYNLMLLGLARARIVEVVSETPYRSARLEVIEESADATRAAELEQKRRALVERFSGSLEAMMGREYREAPLTVLCDLLASTMVRDPRAKQLLLECGDVEQRHDQLLSLLSKRRPGLGEPSAN